MPDLTASARELDALLTQPAIVYGSEPADARDIDLLLPDSDPALDERLRSAGWRRLTDGWFRVQGTSLVALDIDVARASDACVGVSEDQLAKMFVDAVPLAGYRRLHRPAPCHQLLLLARRVTDEHGPIPAKRLERVRRVLAEDPDALLTARSLARAWGCEQRLQVLEEALADDGRVSVPGAVAACAEKIRHSGRAVPVAYVRAASTMFRRPRRGLTVALSGLDGSGKSTQCRALVAALSALGEEAQLEWDRFGTQDVVAHIAVPLKRLLHALTGAEPYVVPPDRAEAVVEDAVSFSRDVGRQLRQRVAPLNVAWLFFLTAVHVSSLRHRNRVHVRAGRVVVHDRYLLDAVVQVRAQYGEGRGVRLAERLMRMAIPCPDVAVLLDVPATEAFRRKTDFSVDELARHRGYYQEVAAALGIPILDGTAPADAIFAELLDRLLVVATSRAA